MAETYTTIVSMCRASYPDCSAADTLTNINLIVRQLCRTMPLYRTSASTNLTNGTQEYALSDTVGQIDKVIYQTSATKRKELTYVSLEELDVDDQYWRFRDAGTPERYYLTQSASSTPSGTIKIGLDPKPDTTTASGYPIITIYYSEIPSADFVTGDTSPQLLESPNVLVYGANMLWARSQKEFEAEAYWEAKYRDEESRQWHHINHRSRHNPPRFDSAASRRVRARV